MNLHDMFYLVGIIFMGMSILLFMGLGFGVLYIKGKIEHVQKDVSRKINSFNPLQIAAHLGSTLAEKFIKKKRR